MPGISISTSVRTGPTSTTVRESSQAFFVGKAERGPADTAIKVYSIEDFENNYGGYVSYGYLHPVVESFFEEGGSQCYIARVVGPAPSTGTLTLDDSASDPALTFDAIGPGAWSSDVEVKVEAGTAAGTKKVTLTYLGVVVFTTGNCSSNEEIAGKFALNTAASRLVTVTVESGGGFVANVAYTALSAGDDDIASVTDTELAAGLDLFNDAYGTGMVSCPEINDDGSTVLAALVTHANAYNRIAVIHGESTNTASNMVTLAQTLQGDPENLEHVGLYYPWVYAPTSIAGVNRLIPPDGYVAGVRARAHNGTGAQAPYAGLISNAKFVNGVATEVDAATGDTLDAAAVNAIRVIAGGVRIYGARSLSTDISNFRYITAQDIVNHVVTEGYRSLEDVVFMVINGRNGAFADVEAKLQAVLEPLRVAGALYEAFDANGKRIDYGYTVKCDASLNPVSQLAEGLVRARVGLRVSSVGDRIEVTIVKSNLTSSVV